MPDLRIYPRARLPAGVSLLFLLVVALQLAGCKQGGQGDYSSTSKAAPLVAAERETTAISSFRKAFGDSTEETGQTTESGTVLAGNSETMQENNDRPALSWTPPLTRENGESLYLSEIQGYRVYYRLRHNSSFQSVPMEGAENTKLPLDNFQPGAYEFCVSVVDNQGLESQRSAPVVIDLI